MRKSLPQSHPQVPVQVFTHYTMLLQLSRFIEGWGSLEHDAFHLKKGLFLITERNYHCKASLLSCFLKFGGLHSGNTIHSQSL